MTLLPPRGQAAHHCPNNAKLRRSVSVKPGPCTARAISQLQLYPRPRCTEERQQSLVPQKQTNTDMQQQQEVFCRAGRRLRRDILPWTHHQQRNAIDEDTMTSVFPFGEAPVCRLLVVGPSLSSECLGTSSMSCVFAGVASKLLATPLWRGHKRWHSHERAHNLLSDVGLLTLASPRELDTLRAS